MGTADMGACEYTGTHTLEANRFELSEAMGGTVSFTLDGKASNAGRVYLLLGSITGTAPGMPLPGGQAILPLNWDLFTVLVLANLNSPAFQGFMSTLGSNGTAMAVFNTLGPMPGTAGLTLSFAYCLNDPWDFVSNPVQVAIVD